MIYYENIDNAFDRDAVRSAWARFVESGDDPGRRVRRVIAASWERSRKAGLDARRHHAARVEAARLHERRSLHRDLVWAGNQAWEVVSENLLTTGSVFVLTDPSGVMLDVKGNEELLEAAAANFVAPGYDWHEARAGTNAIGTALATGSDTIIRTDEHFCVSAKVWDCAAALVRDLFDGTVLGVVDITSIGDLSDKHTLALAVTAAKQIEQTLHSRELARSVQLHHWYRRNETRWGQRPTVLVDRRGRVISYSAKGSGDGVFEAVRTLIVDGEVRLESPGDFEIDALKRYPAPSGQAAEHGSGWPGGALILRPARSAASTRTPHAAVADRPAAFRRIATRNRAMLELMDSAGRMARATAAILITGETGVGKELFARAIHESSGVNAGPFVAVNCGTITRDLAASELLGYEPGAFTGASSRGRTGKFEEADGGTLFLDEIGELSADVQTHLLRVLQDGVVVRLGGNAERRVSVRVIAATNRDLTASAFASFREDLYFRLNVLRLFVPPLRERPDDVPLLAERFLRAVQDVYGLGPKWISDELMEELTRHPWPGNVRQLQGVIESMYVMSGHQWLTHADLPEDFRLLANGAADATTRPGSDIRTRERALIREALAAHDNNLSRAAASLGIARSTLYRKLGKYGISR